MMQPSVVVIRVSCGPRALTLGPASVSLPGNVRSKMRGYLREKLSCEPCPARNRLQHIFSARTHLRHSMRRVLAPASGAIVSAPAAATAASSALTMTSSSHHPPLLWSPTAWNPQRGYHHMPTTLWRCNLPKVATGNGVSSCLSGDAPGSA